MNHRNMAKHMLRVGGMKHDRAEIGNILIIVFAAVDVNNLIACVCTYAVSMSDVCLVHRV